MFTAAMQLYASKEHGYIALASVAKVIRTLLCCQQRSFPVGPLSPGEGLSLAPGRRLYSQGRPYRWAISTYTSTQGEE